MCAVVVLDLVSSAIAKSWLGRTYLKLTYFVSSGM